MPVPAGAGQRSSAAPPFGGGLNLLTETQGAVVESVGLFELDSTPAVFLGERRVPGFGAQLHRGFLAVDHAAGAREFMLLPTGDFVGVADKELLGTGPFTESFPLSRPPEARVIDHEEHELAAYGPHRVFTAAKVRVTASWRQSLIAELIASCAADPACAGFSESFPAPGAASYQASFRGGGVELWSRSGTANENCFSAAEPDKDLCQEGVFGNALKAGNPAAKVFTGADLSYELTVTPAAGTVVVGTFSFTGARSSEAVTRAAADALEFRARVGVESYLPLAWRFTTPDGFVKTKDYHNLPGTLGVTGELALQGGVRLRLLDMGPEGTEGQAKLEHASARAGPGHLGQNPPGIGYKLSFTTPMRAFTVEIPRYGGFGDVPAPERYKIYRPAAGGTFKPLTTVYDAATNRFVAEDANISEAVYFAAVPDPKKSCAEDPGGQGCLFAIDSTRRDLRLSELTGPPLAPPSGLVQVGRQYEAGPEGPFMDTARVSFRLTDQDREQAALAGVGLFALRIHQTLPGDGAWGPELPNQVVDGDKVTAEVDGISSVFGLFGRTGGGAGGDVLPPATTLVIEGGSLPVDSQRVYVRRGSTLSLTVADFGSPPSGPWVSLILPGQPFVDPQATPLGLYRGPFRVDDEGSFPLSFRSMDRAGNQEALQSRTLLIDGTGPQTQLTVNGVARAEQVLDVDAGDLIALETGQDPAIPGSGEPGSGAAATHFLRNADFAACGFPAEGEPFVDPAAAPGSCANPVYAGPFSLSGAFEFVSFFTMDRLGNRGTLRRVLLRQDHKAPVTRPPYMMRGTLRHDRLLALAGNSG